MVNPASLEGTVVCLILLRGLDLAGRLPFSLLFCFLPSNVFFVAFVEKGVFLDGPCLEMCLKEMYMYVKRKTGVGGQLQTRHGCSNMYHKVRSSRG